MRRSTFIFLAWLLVAAAPAAASQSPPIEIWGGAKAQSLVFGPDGNLWFTANNFTFEGDSSGIGRNTPDGEVRQFSLPEGGRTGIGEIAVGAEGNIWFAHTAADAIGRSDLEGHVTEFPLPQGSSPQGIVAGPDGAIWFTESGAGRLGRIDSSGSVASFPLPIGSHPLALAVADGALWVTENGRNAIARVSPDGAVAEHPLPQPDRRPRAIVRSGDDSLWFSEERGSRIGRLGPGGTIAEYKVPGNARGTDALATGPDGTVFFVTGSERARVEVGSLSSKGELTGLGCPSVSCDLPVSALTVGPEGDLWYGTDVGYYGGGGGGEFQVRTSPGTVGRFEPPSPVAITIPRPALRVRGHFAHLALICRSPSEVGCVGHVSLEGNIRNAKGRVVRQQVSHTSYFWMAARSRHQFSLLIPSYAMDILHRRPLRVMVRAVVHGGFEATRRFTLRPPRHH
jgi:virginiamycin B lyase